MKYLELAFATPQQNLACDEALLLGCEERDEDEILRFWEGGEHFAVLGYSSGINAEVHLSACRERGVPVLRRLSGGGAVLQGPGCLSYALILKIRGRSLLRDIAQTNLFIMGRLKQALEPLLESSIAVQGFSDFALGTQKFSGNSQYRKRRALLFHGTFLLNFDIALIEKLLPPPRKQPLYRQNRPHEKFLTNLNLPDTTIKAALRESWGAEEELKKVPYQAIDTLVRERYSRDEWNLRS